MQTSLFNGVCDVVRDMLSEESDLLNRLVARGIRFESWIKIEAYRRLIRRFPELRLEIERGYEKPGSKQRCDLWSSNSDGEESWIELKLCITNYWTPGKNITQQVSEIVADIEKLRGLPKGIRKLLFLGYPLPSNYIDHPNWIAHLARIRAASPDLVEIFRVPIAFSGRNGFAVGYAVTP